MDRIPCVENLTSVIQRDWSKSLKEYLFAGGIISAINSFWLVLYLAFEWFPWRINHDYGSLVPAYLPSTPVHTWSLRNRVWYEVGCLVTSSLTSAMVRSKRIMGSYSCYRRWSIQMGFHLWKHVDFACEKVVLHCNRLKWHVFWCYSY
jgi:hypothetical protein